MENSSKALLIAATLIIVILLVTIGIKILSSSTNTEKQADEVGMALLSTTKDASGDATKEITQGYTTTDKEKKYNITVELDQCSANENNPRLLMKMKR